MNKFLKCDNVKAGDYVKVVYEHYEARSFYKVADPLSGKDSILVFVEEENKIDLPNIKGWKNIESKEPKLAKILPTNKLYWYIYDWEKVSFVKVLSNE